MLYLAIFLKKNANLLGVFLKQYKNGQFFFINFLICPIIFEVSETYGTVD